MRYERTKSRISQSQVDGIVDRAQEQFREMDLPIVFSRLREIVKQLDGNVSAFQAQLERRDSSSPNTRELSLMHSLDEAAEALPKLEHLITALEVYRANSSSPDGT